MSDTDWVEPVLISADQAKAVLKQHFPEYMTGYCLCGSPIGTYLAWIDHVVDALKSSAAGEENETGDDRDV